MKMLKYTNAEAARLAEEIMTEILEEYPALDMFDIECEEIHRTAMYRRLRIVPNGRANLLWEECVEQVHQAYMEDVTNEFEYKKVIVEFIKNLHNYFNNKKEQL